MVGHKHTRFAENCSDCCGEKMAQLESEIKDLEVLLEKKNKGYTKVFERIQNP
jgi:hypothetical protein